MTDFYDICRHLNPWIGTAAAVILGYRIATLFSLRHIDFHDERINKLYWDRQRQISILLFLMGAYVLVLVLATILVIDIDTEPGFINLVISLLNIALIVACVRWPTRKKIFQ